MLWWLYESGLEVDELIEIAMSLGSFGQGAPRGHRMNFAAPTAHLTRVTMRIPHSHEV